MDFKYYFNKYSHDLTWHGTLEWIFYLLISLFFIYILWKIIIAEFKTYECSKSWHEVGFIFNPMDKASINTKSQKNDPVFIDMQRRWQADRMSQYRKTGNCPPVYPNGWYGVMDSQSLEPGQSYAINMIGLNLVVFREQENFKLNKKDRPLKPAVHILDATCPHLGANLGVGGRVHEDRIECPFHGWQFRGNDGQCIRIPYKKDSNPIPPQCNIKSYPSCEINGWIHIWFNSEGEPPTWKIPIVPQVELKYWKLQAKVGHEVLAHIQELPENAGDVAHLSEVHMTNILAGTDLRFLKGSAGFGDGKLRGFWSKLEAFISYITPQYCGHRWQASWAPLDPEEELVFEEAQENLVKKRFGAKKFNESLSDEILANIKFKPAPIGQMIIIHEYKIFGITLPFMTIKVKARQTGPAIVHLIFKSKLFGQGAFMQYVTPLEPLKQRLVHHTWVSSLTPAILGHILAKGEAIQVERDIMIWNNKSYVKSPIVVKSQEDALLLSHRKWYSQFYSPNSPTIQSTVMRKDPSLPVGMDW